MVNEYARVAYALKYLALAHTMVQSLPPDSNPAVT